MVRFRVELKGRLWYCLCGHWCFNVGFSAIGKGEDFNLSDVLPDPKQLNIQDWKGCDTRCIELYVTVPAGRIPAERCGTVYECAAWFELRCCGECKCDKDSDSDKRGHLAVAGFEDEGQYMFV